MRTPSEIIEQLSRGPEALRSVLADVPEADLKRRPQPGRWSAHEHACHLALMEPLWAARVERILAEETPTILSYEPDADEPEDKLLNMDLTRALDAYDGARQKLVARLKRLTSAQWQRAAINTAHARYSLFLMCRHAVLHDALHTYRIEESALGTHWPEERT